MCYCNFYYDFLTCCKQYTTEDAAVETRHALHGVKWPTSNPKTLVVEFASHDDLAAVLAQSEEADAPRKPEPAGVVEGWVADQARIKDKTRRVSTGPVSTVCLLLV